MKTLFVTGTDTDVGKTWISCLILSHLAAEGRSVGAYKPACSGATSDPNGRPIWTDVEQLANAITKTSEDTNRSPASESGIVERICPQRFLAPLAPNMAAAAEGKVVDDALLRHGLKVWENVSDFLVIEGAGGLMCPLSDESTVLQLANQVKAPMLIVAGNKLGVVNHTMLTVDVAIRNGLDIAAVVLNDCSPVEDSSDQSQSSNFQLLLQQLPDVQLLRCAFNSKSLITSDGETLNVSQLFSA